MAPAGWQHNPAYFCALGVGLPAALAVLWVIGGLQLRSRYVGAMAALYIISGLLLIALRSAANPLVFFLGFIHYK